MFIKGQDRLACLQLCLDPEPDWTYAGLAERIGLSTGAPTWRCTAPWTLGS